MTTDTAVKILAVVGGGVLGGVTLGLLAQLLMRAFTLGKLPRWPILIVRLLGGGICAWILASLLFGGGGSGIGGQGGWLFGSGSGKGDGEKITEDGKKDNNGKKEGNDNKPPDSATLRIEVLGDAALSEDDIKANRRYRLETKDEPRLRTLAEVQNAVKERQKEQPPLRRVDIVLYKDSPSEGADVVRPLLRWCRELNDGKMRVDTSKPGTTAPRK